MLRTMAEYGLALAVMAMATAPAQSQTRYYGRSALQTSSNPFPRPAKGTCDLKRNYTPGGTGGSYKGDVATAAAIPAFCLANGITYCVGVESGKGYYFVTDNVSPAVPMPYTGPDNYDGLMIYGYCTP